MGVAAGPGIFKFFSIAFYGLIVIMVFAGIFSGIMEYRKTGDKAVLIDSTLGRVVYFDGQIYMAMSQLLDEDLLKTIPESLRQDYKAGLGRQVLLYLFIFIIFGFLLFKLGNWACGKSQFEPTTDLLLISGIIAFFFFAELLYGYLMNKPIVPFKGLWTFFTNMGVWWDALSGVISSTIPPAIENISTTTIDLGG